MLPPSGSCLDIAVGHRLRRLVAPVPQQKTLRAGNHSILLRGLARSITRPKEAISAAEINFTVWLSLPVSTGGVAVMLEQPANTHPYHLGREATFKSCPTLVALEECFSFASSGSLTLDQVTVIDDLPYTRKKDMPTVEYRYRIRGHVANIVHEKRPFIILCMSKEEEDVPSPTVSLKRRGIGNIFAEPSVRIGGDHVAKRISAFHPSYALYRRPYESAFRQLLLLEISHACGELRGDWKEEEWMQDLRRYCQRKASQDQKPGVSWHLTSSLNAISSLLTILSSSETETASDLGRLLRETRASEHCNDASLCLQNIDMMYKTDHPANACEGFLKKILKTMRGTTLLLANKKDQLVGLYMQESVLSVAKKKSL